MAAGVFSQFDPPDRRGNRHTECEAPTVWLKETGGALIDSQVVSLKHTGPAVIDSQLEHESAEIPLEQSTCVEHDLSQEWGLDSFAPDCESGAVGQPCSSSNSEEQCAIRSTALARLQLNVDSDDGNEVEPRNIITFKTCTDRSVNDAPRQASVGRIEPVIDQGMNAVTVWQPGALVDKLVDDFSGIWTGAVVQAVRPGNIYDILYVDTGVMEKHVDGEELRSRQTPFQLGYEFWEITSRFVGDGLLLCALEQVEKASRSAISHHVQALWSVLYHCNFGPCGTRCELQRTESLDVARAARIAPECARIAADSALSPLRRQRMPWKERYAERYMDTRLHGQDEDTSAFMSPSGGGQHFGVSGGFIRCCRDENLDGRLRFGQNALRGSVYDAILGRMVSEDGGTGNRVLVSRGRTWYAY